MTGKFMRLGYILLLSIAVVSCSKSPRESSSSSDSTAVASDAGSGNVTPTAVRATISPDEADRVELELFMWLRREFIFRKAVAFKEEFSTNGNRFTYMLLVHRGDEAGPSANEWKGYRSPSQEEIDAWQKDTVNNPRPDAVPYTQVDYEYLAQIDTFYVDGKYESFEFSDPEATPRKLQINVKGLLTHKNDHQMEGDQPKFYVHSDSLGWWEWYFTDPMFIVDLSQPFHFDHDQLYLKAKLMDLTEQDVAGLSKEQLSLVRNDIFARHGHTFKTPKMADHYRSTEWYNPVIADAAPLLNKFEKRNVDFIKKKEG